MAEVEETDIIEGASLRTRANDIVINRRFIVKDVTGPRENRLINADQLTGVPRVGDPYPVATSPLIFVSSKSTKPIKDSSGQFEIMCVYEPQTPENQPADDNGPATKSVGGSVVGAQTTDRVDSVGNRFPVVLFRGNQGDDDFLPKQSGLVSKQIPLFTLIFNRHEQSDPKIRARQFLGKMNNQSFDGFDAETVFCSRLEGTTSNGGISFQVTYEFQIKDDENGWLATAVYIDQDTDKPLVDASFSPPDDETLLDFAIYEQVDFNLLNLL